MKHRLLATSLSAPLLLVGCATSKDAGAGPETSPPGAATSDTAPETVLRAAEVDDAPPIALDEWRKINDEGKAAIKTAELADRIEKCKRFVSEHGEHQESREVLEALADAMLETGKYDAAELARFVEQRCKTDEGATDLPVELVRNYHIKHKLPVDSALRLLDEARARIDEDWKTDVDGEKDESARKRAALYLSYQKIQTWILQGRVLLQHEQAAGALKALQRGHEEAKNFPYDIEMVGTDGKTRGTLGSGLLDDLHVLTAAALLGLDRKDDAKKAFSRAVGFVNDVETRAIYDETRKALGLATKDERDVTAQALPAQNFELEDLSGKKVKLSDYRGKVVLVTFWATWCGPCKKEMPELQKFLKANKSKGVEVLAINTDSFTERSKVKPFVDEHDLDLEVLFEQPEQLSEYNYRAIPALYVIDRKGRVAHARTGYDPDLETKLQNEIADLVDGKTGESSRALFTIEKAPLGFDVRWKRTVTGDANAVAIAPPLGGAPGEVAVLGREGLMRWTATGDEQSAQPVAGYSMSLDAADLDGNGKREWVIGGWQSLKVFDSTGNPYWDYATQRMASVIGIDDLDGDGFREIVVEDEDRVLAMKAVPEPRWTVGPLEEIEAVELTDGKVMVQTGGKVVEYAGDGGVSASSLTPPEGRRYRASIGTGKDRVALFGGRWDAQPDTAHDIDGDGRNDVVVSNESGLVAYDADGNSILRIRGKDASLQAAVGDLDGKPGAEIMLFIDHYGLVVLGNKN